jgi:transcriptional regulator with XRE-family HTH domain
VTSPHARPDVQSHRAAALGGLCCFPALESCHSLDPDVQPSCHAHLAASFSSFTCFACPTVVHVQAHSTNDRNVRFRNVPGALAHEPPSYGFPLKDIAIRLAERVRELRLSSRLTQAELAARAGVTVETVARLERVLRGRSSANANPSLETLARLAGALGVEVPDLLSVPSKPKPREDLITGVLRGASPATRRRVLRVAEALVREERAEGRPQSHGKRKNSRA